jgi:hypothetical protein
MLVLVAAGGITVKVKALKGHLDMGSGAEFLEGQNTKC